MSSQEIIFVFEAYLVLLAMQFVGWSLVQKVAGRLVDSGWGVARIVCWLLIGLPAWWLAHVGVSLKIGLWIAVGLVIFLSGVVVWREKEPIRRAISRSSRFIITSEILFLLGFLAMSITRAFNPNILDLEKFMDGGLIQSYLRAGQLPIEDMWLAGETVNYYTFGHFLGSVMLRIWGVELAYGYNLLLGSLMGLALVGGFSLIINLVGMLDKKKGVGRVIGGGIVGSLLLVVGGNSHAIVYFLRKGSFEGYWYADATRFIENTIHEFPSYSFIVSDLHGHLWDLPIVLLFLVVVLLWSRSLEDKQEWWSLVVGGLLGVMAMTNTWDIFIYGLLTGVVGVLLLLGGRVGIDRLIRAASLALLAFVLVSAFWWWGFENISEGVRWVQQRSPLWAFLSLWTIQILMSLAAGGMAMKIERKKRRVQILILNVMVVSMVVVIACLLLLPEIIYIKDIYPNHPRANTMFKLTYQAFVMMAILGGWLFAQLPRRSRVVMGVVVLSLLVFPYFGYRDYYGRFKTLKGLNGLAWLATQYPDDYKAILFINQEIDGRPVILEAVGESYTTFARVSTFTGLPTVLGWRVHEWLWRGGFEIPAARTEEVKQIFEKPRSEAVVGLLQKYKIKYVFLGAKEREVYRVDEKGLLGRGKVVFESGRTRVIEVSD